MDLVPITVQVPRADKEAAQQQGRAFRRTLQDILGPTCVRRLREYCKTQAIEPYPDERELDQEPAANGVEQ